ncbi:MAG: lipid kinase [Cyanobacteria bacterium SW_9_44_58]|nr:MAG: lipid kinase [Cyanobacteria bacterium SW_9_44_58]
MPSALLLINPHSRQGKKSLPILQRYLQAMGINLLQKSSEHPGQLSELIRTYQHEVDFVIIGGGDGTLNAAIAGLVDTQLPLGILPLGTANDLARTLGVPFTLSEACKVIMKGKRQAIDLGKVNEQYFFNVASLGLSVDITNQLTKVAKQRWGIFAYAVTACKVLWKSRPFSTRIYYKTESEQGEWHVAKVKTVQIAIGNGRHYGGGMTIVHDAAIHDQRLDLYSLEIRHWWEMIKLLPSLRSGRYPQKKVRLLEGQEFFIETKKPYPINTDGEITVETPAKFEVVPQALQVIIP